MPSDDEYVAHTLGTRLKLIEPPASRFGVSDVVIAGRRSVRRRRAGATFGALALVAAIGIPVALTAARMDRPGPDATADRSPGPVRPAQCTVTEIAVPDQGAVVGVDHVDPTGRLMLGAMPGPEGTRLVRWRDGVPTVFDVPRIGHPLMVSGMDPDGGFVGTAEDGPDTFGYLYRDEAVTLLRTPDGYDRSVPLAVNAAGDVVGTASSADPARYARLTIWPAGAYDAPRVIEPDRDSIPRALAPDGTIVGLLNGAANRGVAVLWHPDGTRQELATPPGWSTAEAIHIHGDHVYGQVTAVDVAVQTASRPATAMPSSPSPGTPRSIRTVPVRWNLRTGAVTVFDTFHDRVLAASPTGWFVVRWSKPGAGSVPVVVSPRGEARQLPLPHPGTDGPGFSINWVSDDGRTVIGMARASTGQQRPVTWRCR